MGTSHLSYYYHPPLSHRVRLHGLFRASLAPGRRNLRLLTNLSSFIVLRGSNKVLVHEFSSFQSLTDPFDQLGVLAIRFPFILETQ